MATPLRTRKTAPRRVSCAAPASSPAACAPVDVAPVSTLRVKAPPPPVVVPPVVFVRVLSFGRSYVTFSGVKGADTVRVTYRTGYMRVLPRLEALAAYADLVARGFRDPAALFARETAA